MTKTTNYQLNQWAKSDRIMMDDFNADNAKIDAALAGAAKIATGSYTGTGEYGSAHPTTLTFAFAPKAIILWNFDVNAKMKAPMLLVAPYTEQEFAVGSASGYPIHVTWSGNSVSFYSTHYADCQFNGTFGTNYYLALG